MEEVVSGAPETPGQEELHTHGLMRAGGSPELVTSVTPTLLGSSKAASLNPAAHSPVLPAQVSGETCILSQHHLDAADTMACVCGMSQAQMKTKS